MDSDHENQPSFRKRKRIVVNSEDESDETVLILLYIFVYYIKMVLKSGRDGGLIAEALSIRDYYEPVSLPSEVTVVDAIVLDSKSVLLSEEIFELRCPGTLRLYTRMCTCSFMCVFHTSDNCHLSNSTFRNPNCTFLGCLLRILSKRDLYWGLRENSWYNHSI